MGACGFGSAADPSQHSNTGYSSRSVTRIPNVLLAGQGDVMVQLLEYSPRGPRDSV